MSNAHFFIFIYYWRHSFAHRDLHSKNILVKRDETNVHAFYDGLHNYTWYTTALTVKIVDFGLSFVQLTNGEKINPSKSDCHSSDVDGLHRCLSEIRVRFPLVHNKILSHAIFFANR